MKKVKYSNVGGLFYGSLTNGAVYDVVRHIPDAGYNKHKRGKIELMCNHGYLKIYDIYVESSGLSGTFFEDVTTEYRDEIINTILE